MGLVPVWPPTGGDDARGVGHNVNLQFTKQDDNLSWTMEALIDPADGIVIDGLVEGIRFNDDGSFQLVDGVGQGDIDISIQFNSVPSSMTMTMDFGRPGLFRQFVAEGDRLSLAEGSALVGIDLGKEVG